MIVVMTRKQKRIKKSIKNKPAGKSRRNSKLFNKKNPSKKKLADVLSEKDVHYFKRLLTAKLIILRGDVGQMENELKRDRQMLGSQDISNFADLGSDNNEQEFISTRLSHEADEIYEIEDALERIKQGTFGICEITGKQISKERLYAIPYTRFSIEAARMQEAGLLSEEDFA